MDNNKETKNSLIDYFCLPLTLPCVCSYYSYLYTTEICCQCCKVYCCCIWPEKIDVSKN